jgi:hypothetical protein
LLYFVDFIVIWYILPRFGMLYQEKSGNPDRHPVRRRLDAITGNKAGIAEWALARYSLSLSE